MEQFPKLSAVRILNGILEEFQTEKIYGLGVLDRIFEKIIGILEEFCSFGIVHSNMAQ
jgi:hypothetical protein